MDLVSSSGAVVFAYAYLTRQSRHSAILLQDLIWRRHNGPIPERKRVVHRNHISMDNRLDNLCLIDIRNAHVWYTRTNAVKSSASSSLSNSPSNDKATANDLHLTLYWAAIQQLPPEQQSVSNSTASNGATSNTASQANEVSLRRPACHQIASIDLPFRSCPPPSQLPPRRVPPNRRQVWRQALRAVIITTVLAFPNVTTLRAI